jgi:hypothetical protein
MTIDRLFSLAKPCRRLGVVLTRSQEISLDALLDGTGSVPTAKKLLKMGYWVVSEVVQPFPITKLSICPRWDGSAAASHN